MNQVALLPCPFCGGQGVENWKREPVRVGPANSGSEGYAQAWIHCTKCGLESKKHTLDCGPRDGTAADVQEALVHARIYWNARPCNGTVEHIRQTIMKEMRKQDNEDRTGSWNTGFDACCQFILDEIISTETK